MIQETWGVPQLIEEQGERKVPYHAPALRTRVAGAERRAGGAGRGRPERHRGGPAPAPGLGGRGHHAPRNLPPEKEVTLMPHKGPKKDYPPMPGHPKPKKKET